MKFTVETLNDRPFARFEPSNILLSFFLDDARSVIPDFLEEINLAKAGEKVPSGFTCDHVDVSFYKDRAVIEDLWPQDDQAPEKTELPLEVAEKILLEWQSILHQLENSLKIRPQKYSRVTLLTNKYEIEGVSLNSKGYVIEVYENAYEVEFSNENGETIAQLVLKQEDISVDEE